MLAITLIRTLPFRALPPPPPPPGALYQISDVGLNGWAPHVKPSISSSNVSSSNGIRNMNQPSKVKKRSLSILVDSAEIILQINE